MRNKKGIAALYLLILLIPLVGLASLVIDSAEGYSLKSKIKNAVDFSALAGISQLKNSQNSAKNTALEYLNDNLSSTIPNFQRLAADSNGISIQLGNYDSMSMTFTPNESINANSLMISYVHKKKTGLGSILMIDYIDVYDSAISALQAAGQLAKGGGFPLAINSSELSIARTNNNMINLIQQGGNKNSYFTAFSDSNASANDIKQIIKYFEDPSSGLEPPSLIVGKIFQINNGAINSIYNDLDSTPYIGMTFIFPIVSIDGNFTNDVKVEGFVGLQIDNVSNNNIAGTVIPGYIDNKWSGLTVSAGPGNINPDDQGLLANAFGLIQ